MRLVHLSDLHLSFVQGQKATPTGRNQREADVHATFTRVIDRVIEVAPDVVVIAGDVFHASKPTTNATVHAFREFSRLVTALPGNPVVIAAGNHDLSNEISSACILDAFSALGIHVAGRVAKRFDFPDLDLSILAVPDAPCVGRPKLDPNPNASRNVLVLHGEVAGMLPAWMSTDRADIEISHDELAAGRWDYIALGHFHIHTVLAPNVAYSGSIDYTSFNPWQEIATPKGFVERDLETGISTFHAVTPARAFIDLAPIHGDGMGAEAVSDAIAAAVASCSAFDGSAVRLIVHDVSRSTQHELDHTMIRECKRRALSFRLDIRQPEKPSLMSQIVGSVDAPMTPDRHEEALMEADMRAEFGDDSPLSDDGSEYGEPVRRILAGHGASLSFDDPYGLDALSQTPVHRRSA